MTSTSADRRPLSAVGEIRVERAAEAMASRLRAAILSGETEAGSLLPTERDLAEQSGLSRGSVRQALQSLAAEGLVSAKVGRNGGYLVQRPPRESFVRSLDVFIRGRRIHHDSLLEVREVIEPRCAGLAAERGTESEIARLRELTERMAGLTTDIPAFLDLNIDWHLAVAEASGNEVFSSIMAAISSNLRSLIATANYRSVANMRSAQHLHEVVLDAIERQDADTAERRMARHIDAASGVIDGSTRETAPAATPTNKTPPAKKPPAKKSPAKKTARTAVEKTAKKSPGTRTAKPAKTATTPTATTRAAGSRARRGGTQT